MNSAEQEPGEVGLWLTADATVELSGSPNDGGSDEGGASSRLLGGSVFQMAVAQVKRYCVSIANAIHGSDINNAHQRHLAIAVAQAILPKSGSCRSVLPGSNHAEPKEECPEAKSARVIGREVGCCQLHSASLRYAFSLALW